MLGDLINLLGHPIGHNYCDKGDVLFQLGEVEEANNYWQKAGEQGRQTKTLEKKISVKTKKRK